MGTNLRAHCKCLMPKEIRPPGTEARDSCEPNPSPQLEQQVLLTPEPSPQPQGSDLLLMLCFILKTGSHWNSCSTGFPCPGLRRALTGMNYNIMPGRALLKLQGWCEPALTELF